MTKRPIYIFTHKFPEEDGEVYLNDEISAIENQGYEITYCPYNVSSQKQNVLNKGLIKARSDKRKAISYVLGDFFVAPLLLTVKRFRYNIALVSERIAAARFYASKLKENAIVYTYWFDELAITASFIKQFRPDIKWVSRAHGFDVYKEQSDDDFLFFKQNKLAWIDKLFVVSKNGFEYSKNQQPRYASKMSFSYLGTKSFGPSSIPLEDTISIVSCAFIRDIKRLDLLMDSLALIKNKKVKWHVIGDGPELELLKNKSESLPENIRCIFHGNCSKEEISDIYKLPFDCFINVSSSEGLPVSIMEAISAGIPIIATDVGGTSEIVNDHTGYLVSKEISKEELANSILDSIGHFRGKGFRMGVQPYWNEHFNADVNFAKFYKAISE